MPVTVPLPSVAVAVCPLVTVPTDAEQLLAPTVQSWLPPVQSALAFEHLAELAPPFSPSQRQWWWLSLSA